MKVLFILMVLSLMVIPVSAIEFTAPDVPESAEYLMPSEPESFGQGLLEILKNVIGTLAPNFAEAGQVCLKLFAMVLLLSVLRSFDGASKRTVDLAGTVAIGGILLSSTNSMLNLATETVMELSDYGRMLLPVLTGALAAQGGLTSSAALYTGTAFFTSLLSTAISKVLIPLVYVYMALAVANHAIGDDLLKKLQDFVKWFHTWFLRVVLYVFTGYMGITGAVSGGTDAATLKVTKLTISGMVPVVGGILADASESVLVGAGVMKNATGVYGLLAILAVCIGPFLKIGLQYLLLKLTAGVCSVFDVKNSGKLVQDFSGIMGFLLGMTGSACLLMLISIVCFLKGVG